MPISDNIIKLAASIQEREAPGAAEGVYHQSQEQSTKATTRYGVDLTKFPKQANETDINHFARVYGNSFQATHEDAVARLPKADSQKMLRAIWNTGTDSSLSQQLRVADMSTTQGQRKLFAKMNSWIGLNNNKNWSSGLVTARAKDWNNIAEAYAPNMVIDSVKYYDVKGVTYRQYLNAKGEVLRTMFNKKPLASNNKSVVGTTVKIGD